MNNSRLTDFWRYQILLPLLVALVIPFFFYLSNDEVSPAYRTTFEAGLTIMAMLLIAGMYSELSAFRQSLPKSHRDRNEELYTVEKSLAFWSKVFCAFHFGIWAIANNINFPIGDKSEEIIFERGVFSIEYCDLIFMCFLAIFLSSIFLCVKSIKSLIGETE